MSTDKRYNVVLSAEITDAATGEAFASQSNVWANAKYGDVVMLEMAHAAMMQILLKAAIADVANKDPGNADLVSKFEAMLKALNS